MFAAILYPDGVLDHMTVLGDNDQVPKELFDLAYTEDCELWLHYFVNNGKIERNLRYNTKKHDWWHVFPNDVPNVFKLALAVAS